MGEQTGIIVHFHMWDPCYFRSLAFSVFFKHMLLISLFFPTAQTQQNANWPRSLILPCLSSLEVPFKKKQSSRTLWNTTAPSPFHNLAALALLISVPLFSHQRAETGQAGKVVDDAIGCLVENPKVSRSHRGFSCVELGLGLCSRLCPPLLTLLGKLQWLWKEWESSAERLAEARTGFEAARSSKPGNVGEPRCWSSKARVCMNAACQGDLFWREQIRVVVWKNAMTWLD